jgi:hypothetical protein
MTVATVLISKLVRAANRIRKIKSNERAQLVEDGIRLIKQMRMETGTRDPIPLDKDGIRFVDVAALLADEGSDEEAKAILLKIADMIRVLKIALDAKASPSSKGTPH